MSLLVRGGEPVAVNRDTVRQPADEVLVAVGPDQPVRAANLFQPGS